MDISKGILNRWRMSAIWVHADDPIMFTRPPQMTGIGIPTPAAGMAHPLPLGKECLASLQVCVEPRVLQRYGGLTRQEVENSQSLGSADASVTFQIQHPDQLRLRYDRQTMNGNLAL